MREKVLSRIFIIKKGNNNIFGVLGFFLTEVINTGNNETKNELKQKTIEFSGQIRGSPGLLVNDLL